MIEIHSNATIYTVVPCNQEGPHAGEADAEYRGGEYICDDLHQAAVVREALNIRHQHEGRPATFCIESSDKFEDVYSSLATVYVESKRVLEYLVNEMGVDESTAKKWIAERAD